MLTPEQGADTLIWLASAREVEGRTGGYWARRRLTQPSAAARDPDNRRPAPVGRERQNRWLAAAGHGLQVRLAAAIRGLSPERIAPSMVAGRPVAVQSPARARLRQRVRAAGRLAFCSGVAAKVARRSLTICQGGSSARQAVDVGDVAPQAPRQVLAVLVGQIVGAADRDRDAVLEGEHPLRRPADHAHDRRRAGRRAVAEVAVDDGVEGVGRGEAGDQGLGDPRRRGQDHGRRRRRRDLAVAGRRGRSPARR